MAETSKKMQIVFASAECAPFVKTGGLGDVAGSLPAALVRAGAEVIVMVPVPSASRCNAGCRTQSRPAGAAGSR